MILPAGGFADAVVDLSALPEPEREAAWRRRWTAEARRPFDLARGPLLRAVLCAARRASEHVLLVAMHHIVSDGWSMGVLVREVAALYRGLPAGRPSPLPELPVQYADFAAWQRRWLTGEVLERQLAYWRERLAGAPPVLELPTDRPRPAVQSFRGAARVTLARSASSLAARLGPLGRREGATLFMVLLAAFQALLSPLHRAGRPRRWARRSPAATGRRSRA